MGKFILVVLLTVGIILVVRDWDSEESPEVAVESEPDKTVTDTVKTETIETESVPEPEPEAKKPEPTIIRTVRVYRAGGRPIVNLCEKVSDIATRLPSPYGEGLRGMIKARERGWCFDAAPGVILKVSDDYWDVHEYPIEENWPTWFPYLIKVYTEDGREWWVREDSLNNDTVVVE